MLCATNGNQSGFWRLYLRYPPASLEQPRILNRMHTTAPHLAKRSVGHRDLLCVLQKERRALSWISRPGVVTSVIEPKPAVLTKRFGVPRLVWLRALKNSPRVSRLSLSVR